MCYRKRSHKLHKMDVNQSTVNFINSKTQYITNKYNVEWHPVTFNE